MRLPFLEIPEEENQRTIINFLGLNYGTQTREGEFSETLNVSTDKFPYITQEKPICKKALGKMLETYGNIMHSREGLYFSSNQDLYYYPPVRKDVWEEPELIAKNFRQTPDPQQSANIGDYIVFFPDRTFCNVKTKETGTLFKTVITSEVTFGKSEDGFSTLRVPFVASDRWRVGDAIEITGCTTFPENNTSAIIRKIDNDTMYFYANTFKKEGLEAGNITIARNVPELEFICESGNRIWGCKGNTIYASKFGDPFNFNVFDGLSSDSYYIDVGTDGEFTGCIPYGSHICFFKENVLHKLYGSRPANYQITTLKIPGVKKDCSASLKVLNEVLCYMGVNGIYRYTGGVPERITESFENDAYREGVAEVDEHKYYISVKCMKTLERELFSYDVEKGIWLRIGEFHISQMANVDNEIIMRLRPGPVTEHYDYFYSFSDVENVSEINNKWSVTFCPFNEIVNERKGYSRLGLRIELEEKAYLVVEVAVDGGNWETVFVTHNERARTINVPIAPNRCDSFQIRLSGEGRCLVKSLVRDFTVGSEV